MLPREARNTRSRARSSSVRAQNSHCSNSPDSSVPHDRHDSRVRARVSPQTGQSRGAWRGPWAEWSGTASLLVLRRDLDAAEVDLDVEATGAAADRRRARVAAQDAGPAPTRLLVIDGDRSEVGLGADAHAGAPVELELDRAGVAADVGLAPIEAAAGLDASSGYVDVERRGEVVDAGRAGGDTGHDRAPHAAGGQAAGLHPSL